MIKLNSIKKSYDNFTALHDITLDIAEGEVFGLLGTNGAGKTTLMNLICGQFLPTSGDISVNGNVPTSALAKGLIGIAPQTLAFYPTLSVQDNLTFFANIYGVGKKETDSALDAVKLRDKQSARADTLSGGMKRRLNLAIAILHNPKILLLDECTVGVDAQSRIEILDIVASLKQRGHTIIYTTHYLEEAEKLCDRLAIIDAGKICAVGTLDELISQYGKPSVLHWHENEEQHQRELINEHQDIKSVLDAHPNAKQFHIERANLEQVFLEVTV